jgi:hypothetical protein
MVIRRAREPMPRGLGQREAACQPETFFALWSKVFDRLQAGELPQEHHACRVALVTLTCK